MACTKSNSHNGGRIKLRIIITAVLILLFVSLAVSIALNYYLFNFGKYYFLQETNSRLDPLGLDYFSDTPIQVDQSDSGKVLIVFFGDSRAVQWPVPSIDGFQFVNRGIDAQTSPQVAQRYNAHVEPLNPDALVVQVCVNDLRMIPLFPERNEAIIDNCKSNILEIIQQANSQGTTAIISTIFPVGPVPIERRLFWSEAFPLAIDKVNSFINSLEGDQVIVFDSFSILVDENGRLADEYRLDELHVNPAGYEALNRDFVELVKSLYEQ